MNYNNFAVRIVSRRSRPEPARPARAETPPPPPAPRPGRLRRLTAPLAATALLLASLTPAFAQAPASVDLDPSIDFLFYPFAGTPGTRTTAYTFGAVGSDGFDNRDAQVFLQFDTSANVTPGLSPSLYQITSATLTLYYAGSSSLVYDGTYDPFSTYTTGTDADAGRPMELYGAGYRNGYTDSTASESMSFSTQPFTTTTDHIRNVFATDFAGGSSINGGSRDVSNNVSDGFDPVPFAIGQVSAGDLTNGLVKKNTAVTFTLNLSDPDLVRYLQLSLADGSIGLVASSLTAASQGGDANYPLYYTKENAIGLSPVLSLQVQTVPEPTAFTLLLCGLALFTATWRGGEAMARRKGGRDVQG